MSLISEDNELFSMPFHFSKCDLPCLYNKHLWDSKILKDGENTKRCEPISVPFADGSTQQTLSFDSDEILFK